jgi:16S rRNA pseudouridine516 synthase
MLKLETLLARNLDCSRSQARRFLDAQTRPVPREVSPEELPLRLLVGGRAVELHDSFHLLMHKPAGCVTALADARHPTASSYLTGAPLRAELRPVGRLDLDTTGLLLWTTDGAWLHRLTHPRSALPRQYQAALARPYQSPSEDLVLRDGYRPRILDLRRLSPDQAHPALLRPAGATSYAAITIAGGAYHEVRRTFAALGSHVLALCRVRFGVLALPADLPPGRWTPIRPADIENVPTG